MRPFGRRIVPARELNAGSGDLQERIGYFKLETGVAHSKGAPAAPIEEDETVREPSALPLAA